VLTYRELAPHYESAKWSEKVGTRNITGYGEKENCVKILEKHLHKDLSPHKTGIMDFS
jgi:hypothetical protein